MSYSIFGLFTLLSFCFVFFFFLLFVSTSSSSFSFITVAVRYQETNSIIHVILIIFLYRENNNIIDWILYCYCIKLMWLCLVCLYSFCVRVCVCLDGTRNEDTSITHNTKLSMSTCWVYLSCELKIEYKLYGYTFCCRSIQCFSNFDPSFSVDWKVFQFIWFKRTTIFLWKLMKKKKNNKIIK